MAEYIEPIWGVSDDKNADEVFVRCVIAGIKESFKDKVGWINRFDDTNREIRVPFYLSLMGDENFIKGTFSDDVPGTRVETNINQIPRAIIVPGDPKIQEAEFVNPNVRVLSTRRKEDGTSEQISSKLKSIPIELTCNITVIIASEVDAYKYFQSFYAGVWPYRYFAYHYNGLRNDAVINIASDTSFSYIRDITYTANTQHLVKHSFSVKTNMPVLTDQKVVNRNIIGSINHRIWDINDPDLKNKKISGPPEDSESWYSKKYSQRNNHDKTYGRDTQTGLDGLSEQKSEE
jgi:hypothetical protein